MGGRCWVDGYMWHKMEGKHLWHIGMCIFWHTRCCRQIACGVMIIVLVELVSCCIGIVVMKLLCISADESVA